MKFVMILSALLLLLVAQPRSQTCGNCVNLGLFYNTPAGGPPPGWNCNFDWWVYCAPDPETEGYCLAYGNFSINNGCTGSLFYPPSQYQFGLPLTGWLNFPWQTQTEPTFSSNEFLLACNPGPTTQKILELQFRNMPGSLIWLHWWVRVTCS